MRRKMSALVVALTIGAVLAGQAAAAAPGDNLNYRSGQVVKYLKTCTKAVTLVRQIIGANGDDYEVSKAASQAKQICDGAGAGIGRTNTKYIRDQALDAQVACDYWERGLGRMVDYIDSRATSDLVTMGNYWRQARAITLGSIADINKQRKKYGLPALKPPSIPVVNF